MTFNSIFSNSAIFYDRFSSTNNFLCQKNELLKTNEILFEFKVVSNKVDGNIVRKTWQTGKPGKIYQNWENLGSIARVE